MAAAIRLPPVLEQNAGGRAFSTVRPRRRSPIKPEARWAKGGKRNSALDWGDVPVDCPGEHMPELKRAMFLSDGAPTVVAITGPPAELKGAMFPSTAPANVVRGGNFAVVALD